MNWTRATSLWVGHLKLSLQSLEMLFTDALVRKCMYCTREGLQGCHEPGELIVFKPPDSHVDFKLLIDFFDLINQKSSNILSLLSINWI